MLNNEQISALILAHLRNELTAEDEALLNDWVSSSDQNRRDFERLKDPEWVTGQLREFYSFDQQQGWEKLNEKDIKFERIRYRLRQFWAPLAAAAAIIIGIAVGFNYLSPDTDAGKPTQKIVAASSDVAAPVSSVAMIRLANGQMVRLDSVGNGEVAQQGGVDVIKGKDGRIVYKGNSAQLSYNTLINPLGGNVVSLVLNDGTKVFLNSGSSIKYPVAFGEKERGVEITGEAYFEVAKDPDRRFVVTSNGIKTSVYGTHFNINSYNDEKDCKITLLEGSVSVENGRNKVMLSPGLQASCDPVSQAATVKSANIDKAIAWKEGIFHFEDDDLPTIMRQLARWYCVDVKFSDKIPDGSYSGIISRSLSLLQVLQIMDVAGIKYDIKGRVLTIDRS